MSKKTLTDELRSVLLYHSLEAPQPNATVDRILNDTVGQVVALGEDGAPAGTAARRGWRVPVQLVAACVIVLLLGTVAGINSVRNRNAARTASQALQAPQPANGAVDSAGSMALPNMQDPRYRAAPANPPAHVGKALDCSTIPGGHLMTGKWDKYTLSTGGKGYLYEFLCVGVNGERSASEVQVFQQVGNFLEYRSTLLRAGLDQHLDFLTGGLDSVRIQTSLHSPPSGGVPGEVISMAWTLRPDGSTDADGSGATVAEPCLREDLTPIIARRDVRPTISTAPGTTGQSWLLALRNRSSAACALEGFPQLRAQRTDLTFTTTAMDALSGAAGGVTKAPVPPIVVLPPGGTATALIEQTTASARCPVSGKVVVTLPNGVSLGEVGGSRLPGCGLVVHPLVGNPTGSD